MLLTWLSKYRDFGLLLMRIGLGVCFIQHGWPKLMGGPAVWEKLGAAMQHAGVTAFPVFWGFMAAFSETIGATLLIIGFLFRPACILLAITMTIATILLYHTSGGDFNTYSHPGKMAVVFYSLIFIGAGRFSVDRS